MDNPKIMYSIKDKSIRIFTELLSTDDSGVQSVTKIYQHPLGTVINAAARQLSATEMSGANAQQDGSDIEFVINRRAITGDMFIECVSGYLIGKVFKIDGIDNLKFYNTEVKIRAHQISVKEYGAVEYRGWLK